MTFKGISFATLLFAFLFAATPLKAESELELLDGKALIEKRMADHFRSIISTNMPAANFEISASVALKKDIAQSKDAGTEKETIPTPSDVNMGLIQADEIIKGYEEELAALKQGPVLKGYPSWFKDYKIKSMTLFVGIKKAMDDKARGDFEKWIKERVVAEFGDAGQVQILLALDDAKIPPKTWLEQLAQIQNLVGLAVLAGTLLLGLLLWKLLGSKDASEARKMTLQLNQKQDLTTTSQAQSDSDGKETPKPVEPEDPNIAVMARRRAKLLIRNIEMLIELLGDGLEKTFVSWLDSGAPGYSKLACVLEVMNNAFDKEGKSQKPHHYNIPIEHRDGVIDSLKEQQSLGLAEKRPFLEAAYLDLTAARFFGEKALKQPFIYISRVGEKAINSVLMEQNPRVRSLVMLHMPPQSRKDYLQSISSAEKQTLFKEIFSLDQLASDELDQTNESMKTKFDKLAGSGKSILPLLPGIVSSLSPLDEVSILSGLKDTSNQVFEEFKRSYPTLAFIDEWPEKQRALLASIADYEEIVALVRVAPALQEKLIASCAPIVARMAQDRLKTPDKTNNDEKLAQLEKLKKKFMNLISTNKLSLKDLYEKASGQAAPAPEQKAAA